MKILRKIQVLTEITDKFQKGFKADINKTIEDLNVRLREIEQEIKKVGKPKTQEEHIRLNNFLHFKEQQLSSIDNLKSRVKTVMKMKDGEWLYEASLDSLIELKVGDDLYDKTRTGKIKVKDGKIIEICE
ncbi:hypothetical protein KAJ27_17235 [bacterium]|nr:hypothetical protein [bacterium]